MSPNFRFCWHPAIQTDTKPLQIRDCLPLTLTANHSVSSSIYFSIPTAMVWQGQYSLFYSPRNKSINCISLCKIILIVPVEMCSWHGHFFTHDQHTMSVGGVLLWWCSGWDSALPMQGAQLRSLVRELDPTCMLQLRVCMPQLRSPGAATKEPVCRN